MSCPLHGEVTWHGQAYVEHMLISFIRCYCVRGNLTGSSVMRDAISEGRTSYEPSVKLRRGTRICI